MRLTSREITNSKPRIKPYGLADGGGLFLWINPNGLKYWHFRYSHNLKQHRISLGTYPSMSLQLARERAAEARALLARGIDPGQKRKQDKLTIIENQTNTFRFTAEEWYQGKIKAGRSASTLGKMRTYLDKDILPVLGNKYLPSISRADCSAVQERIERRGALNVSRKVRQWLREIFSYAIAKGRCEHNAASELKTIAIPTPESTSYPHLLEPELPDFLKALARTTSRPIAHTAALMAIWTASRPGMIRFAEWSEIDLKNALWTIPAKKMKMKRQHVCPLAHQLVEALQELQAITGRHQYLFPGIGTINPTISENTINLVFQKIGYKGKMVGHGSRHTASTLLREHRWEKDYVDMQLAHKKMGTSGIYDHAAYLPQRRAMMQWYADYLDALKTDSLPERSEEFASKVNVFERTVK